MSPRLAGGEQSTRRQTALCCEERRSNLRLLDIGDTMNRKRKGFIATRLSYALSAALVLSMMVGEGGTVRAGGMPPPPVVVGEPSGLLGAVSASCTARVTNSWGLSAVTVGTQFNQAQYLLQPGDTAQVVVPGAATLCIWECLWSGSQWMCNWDCAYTICPNGLYAVNQTGPAYNLNLTMVQPGTCASCEVVPVGRRTWGGIKSYYR